MNRVKTLSIVAVFVVLRFSWGSSSVRAGRAADPAARDRSSRRADSRVSCTARRVVRGRRGKPAAAVAGARLQAQEQRVLYFDRLRSEAATKRSNAEQARGAIESQMQMVDPAELSKLDPEGRRGIEGMMKQWKTQLTLQDRTVQQLQIEETDAANALAQEQGRWNDFNARLDELERTLSQR